MTMVLILTRKLDDFGIDFVEGGMPGSNPKDEQYFQRVRELNLFCMEPGMSKDSGLAQKTSRILLVSARQQRWLN